MEQEYVEKIIQLSFNIPRLTVGDLDAYFRECFPELLDSDDERTVSSVKSVLEGVTNLNPRRIKLL